MLSLLQRDVVINRTIVPLIRQSKARNNVLLIFEFRFLHTYSKFHISEQSISRIQHVYLMR